MTELLRRFFKTPFVLIFLLAALFSSTAFSSTESKVIKNKINDRYSLAIKIDAPPEFLFPYLVEEDKTAKWNKDDGIVVTFPKGIEPKVGKQIHILIKIPGSPFLLMEIVNYFPGRQVDTKLIGGVFEGDFSYILTKQPNGDTLLTQEIEMQPKNKVARTLWKMIGESLYLRKMSRFLKEIKKVVEAEFPQPTTMSVSAQKSE
jgi:hypothetical protein